MSGDSAVTGRRPGFEQWAQGYASVQGMDQYRRAQAMSLLEDHRLLTSENEWLRQALARGLALNMQARMAAQSEMGWEDWVVDVVEWIKDCNGVLGTSDDAASQPPPSRLDVARLSRPSRR